MSKLAPVANGNPTQGIGAVPVAVLEPVAPPLPAINPRSAHSAAAATVTAAWLSLEAKEIEVRQYFRKMSVVDGLEMVKSMRKQCDLAAHEVQQRIDEGKTERCTGCNKTLEEARKSQWIMMGSEVDPDTGIAMPYRFCGPMCVRERNREKMLPPEQRKEREVRFDGQPEGDIR